MKLIGFAILGCAITVFAQTEVVTTAAQTSRPTSSPKKKAAETGKTSPGTESKTEGPIWEYACHEGNYSLTNILAGARAEEKAAAARGGQRQ